MKRVKITKMIENLLRTGVVNRTTSHTASQEQHGVTLPMRLFIAVDLLVGLQDSSPSSSRAHTELDLQLWSLHVITPPALQVHSSAHLSVSHESPIYTHTHTHTHTLFFSPIL